MEFIVSNLHQLLKHCQMQTKHCQKQTKQNYKKLIQWEQVEAIIACHRLAPYYSLSHGKLFTNIKQIVIQMNNDSCNISPILDCLYYQVSKISNTIQYYARNHYTV
jgi:hypothetical protein